MWPDVRVRVYLALSYVSSEEVLLLLVSSVFRIPIEHYVALTNDVFLKKLFVLRVGFYNLAGSRHVTQPKSHARWPR